MHRKARYIFAARPLIFKLLQKSLKILRHLRKLELPKVGMYVHISFKVLGKYATFSQ